LPIEVKIFILLCLVTMGIGIMYYYSKQQKMSPGFILFGGAWGGIMTGGGFVLVAGSIAPRDKQTIVMVCVAVFLALMPLLVLLAGKGSKETKTA